MNICCYCSNNEQQSSLWVLLETCWHSHHIWPTFLWLDHISYTIYVQNVAGILSSMSLNSSLLPFPTDKLICTYTNNPTPLRLSVHHWSYQGDPNHPWWWEHCPRPDRGDHGGQNEDAQLLHGHWGCSEVPHNACVSTCGGESMRSYLYTYYVQYTMVFV